MKTVAPTCMITCVDNGKTMEADVLSFREGEHLSVAIKTVKVGLRFNAGAYVGSMGHLTLTTPGPKVTEYKTGR